MKPTSVIKMSDNLCDNQYKEISENIFASLIDGIISKPAQSHAR
jgi:hypothetical protein